MLVPNRGATSMHIRPVENSVCTRLNHPLSFRISNTPRVQRLLPRWVGIHCTLYSGESVTLRGVYTLTMTPIKWVSCRLCFTRSPTFTNHLYEPFQNRAHPSIVPCDGYPIEAFMVQFHNDAQAPRLEIKISHQITDFHLGSPRLRQSYIPTLHLSREPYT